MQGKWLRAVALLAIALAAADAGAESAVAPPNQRLNVALNADIRNLDPGVNRDENTDLVMHHVVETLVAFRADLTIAPALADSWLVSDDGKTYTFKLRRGVKFHNGAPLTSAEVRWSWERYLRPGSAWSCRSWFDGSAGPEELGVKVVAIDTPDAATVVFRLDRPSALFLAQLASIQCTGAILHPDSVAPDGTWRGPIATGPYRVSEWRRGEYIELQRFADYVPRPEPRSGYAGARIARVERIRFVIVPEAVSALAALRSGAIDVIPAVAAESIPDLRQRKDVRLYDEVQLGWNVLLLNTRDPLLRDARIRQALAYAIDRKGIVETNTANLAKVNSSAVPVGSDYHTAVHDSWYPYDVKHARELLRAAGYRGQPVRIQTNRRYKDMYDNAVLIQAMLVAAGMNAQLDVMDWAAQLAGYRAGKYQLASFAYTARLDPTLMYAGLVGNKAERATVQWEDATAKALLGTLASATDPLVRRQMMEALHRRMVAQVPIIGLYNPDEVAATRIEVHGFEPWPAKSLVLWGVSKD
jgi:peptide/nickel transport system substrate-binding protein